VAVAAAVIATIVGVVVATGSSRAGPAAMGKPAPLFRANDLAGHRVSLADYRGKTVLLNFWASWCDPCRREFPQLKRANAGSVAVLGVIVRDGDVPAGDFMAEQHATWPALKDPDGRVLRAYGVGQGVPVTIAISPRGIVAGRHLGELRPKDLAALVAAAAS
jgi:cytochrome c biogenesis protein CcmG/thiol:disulfide interchange protein DsbE